jgi:hypothetical protein
MEFVASNRHRTTYNVISVSSHHFADMWDSNIRITHYFITMFLPIFGFNIAALNFKAGIAKDFFICVDTIITEVFDWPSFFSSSTYFDFLINKIILYQTHWCCLKPFLFIRPTNSLKLKLFNTHLFKRIYLNLDPKKVKRDKFLLTRYKWVHFLSTQTIYSRIYLSMNKDKFIKFH